MGGSPSAPIDIVNMALDYVGEPPITSFAQNTRVASVCNRHYADIRQTLLRKYVWNFASTPAIITRDAKAPLFDFSDRYVFPRDFIRFLRLGGTADVNVQTLIIMNQQTHDLQTDDKGKYLCLNNGNAPSVQIYYIRDVRDPNLWDVCFRKLVALNLGLEICYALTLQKDVVTRLNKLLELEIPDAASIDGQEVPPVRIQRSKAIAARKLGASSYGVASKYTTLP